MSTNTNTITEQFPGLDKFIATQFEIVRKGKSSWVKDGTGGDTGQPAQYMNTNKTMMLEPISRLFLGKGKGYLRTQYVVGAPTHYIEDYYEDKNGKLVLDRVTPEQAKKEGYQFRPGLKTLGYDLREEYARSMNLDLCFKSGMMDAREYGDDPILLRFLMEHEQNDAAPRANENRDPKRLKLFQFRPAIAEMKASKSKTVENFDDDFAAMELVKGTREKTANGYSYNEPLLDAILAILEDGATLKGGEVNQKFELITRWARKDGPEFVRIVNGTFEDLATEIDLAEKFKVIAFTGNSVKFTDNGGANILELKTTSKADQVKELSIYFIGQDLGQKAYSEVIRLTELAKIAALK